MTSDKDELLAKLAEARAGYKDFAKAVDDDLRREREARLSAERGRIRDIIVHAYVGGATVAELKRAYDTKDYKTIRTILDSAEAEIAALRQLEETGPTDWFSFDEAESNLVYVLDGDGHYWTFSAIYFPDDDDYMLDYVGGQPGNDLVTALDGKFASEKNSPEATTLFRAIRERNTAA